MKETFRKLKYILSNEEKGKMVILFFLMLIGGILEMAGVSLVLPMISFIMGKDTQVSNQVVFFAGLLIVVFIIKNLFLIFMYDAIFRYVSTGSIKLSNRMMKAYLEVDYSFHLKKNVSEIVRAIQHDSDAVYCMIKALLQLAAEGFICIILTIFLLITDFWMCIFLMAELGITCGLFLTFSKKETKRLGKEEMYNIGQTGRWVLQAFGGIKEIKLLGREDFFRQRVEEYRWKSASNRRKQQLLLQMPRLLVETVCIAGVMAIMVYEISAGKDIISLIPKLGVFAVAAFRLLPSVGKINSLIGEALFNKAATDAVYRELKELEQIQVIERNAKDKEIKPIQWKKSLKAIDLSFRYSEDTPMILEHCEIEIPYGTAIGLIGPSGAGKTTLADLLMGMLKPSTGHIEVDGDDIWNNLDGWQKQIGYVPQNIYLSDDTIRANIAFGLSDEEIDDEKIWEALRKAQLDEFVRNKPDGLRTQVGDRGVRLSGGQRQRIGIARALYYDPQFLVFDEATSALDNETEEAVMRAIEALHGSKTMIIIAHRLSTIEACDIVCRVSDGKICKQSKGENKK